MKTLFAPSLKVFLLSLSGILLMICSLLIHHFDPKEVVTRKASLLSPGSIPLMLFKDPPYEVFIKMYVFNITNTEEFMSGKDKNMKFKEIGPYTYREMVKNVETTFHENGTMSFMPVRSLEFAPEYSVNDPKDDFAMVPNVPILAAASMLHDSSMFVNLGLASIMKVLDVQPIRNLTLEEYFWGYDDPLVKSGSHILPSWIDFEKFGLIDRLFNEGENRVNIVVDPSRAGKGSKIISPEERGRLYSIDRWNGVSGLPDWGYKQPAGNETIETNTRCNTIEGASDGSLFPQDMSKDWSFRLYRKAFCRAIPIVYNHTSTVDGFETWAYTLKDDFLDTDNPDNECYCKDKTKCFPSGLGPGAPCYYGFEAGLSKPHFLGVDPKILPKIEGLTPDAEKHETRMYIHPKLGLLMKAYSRMQLNLLMRNTKFIPLTRPFNDMIIPLAWIEISVPQTPDSVVTLVNLLLNVLPVIQSVIMYLFAFIGAALIGLAGYMILFSAEDQSGDRLNLGINLGQYSTLRIIPSLRRESIINDYKDRDRRMVHLNEKMKRSDSLV